MPAGTFTLFKANIDDLRMQDLVGATVKMMLVTSSYTPNAATDGHSVLADITNEIANGNGYTTGGAALANKAVTAVTNGWKYASDNIAWTASGSGIPAWRYAIMYVDGSLWGKTSPLLGYFVGDNTPADIPLTTAPNPLTINCPANGWFDNKQA